MNEVTSESRHLTASAMVFDERGRVLLVLHKAVGKWVFPGGHVDPDESLNEAAHREVLEETGVNGWFRPGDFMPDLTDTATHPIPVDVREFVAPAKPDRPGKPAEPQHHHIDHLFIMGAYSADLKPELTEVDEARWVHPGEINAMDVREDVGIMLSRFSY